MNRITAIKPADKLKRRQKVYLDGRFAFSLAARVAKDACLEVGQELDSERVAALVSEDQRCCSLQHARRYFGYRPQSETELREKMGRKGTPQAEIESACARLKAEGLLDDGSFAQFWKGNRQSFAPRGRQLVCQELRSKGVSEDIIEQVAGEINDNEGAYRAVLDKARRLQFDDYQGTLARLRNYLRRRGFDDEVIQDTLTRILKETGGTNELPSDCHGEEVSHKEVKISD